MDLPTQPRLAFSACIAAAISEVAHLATTFFCRCNPRSLVRTRNKPRISHPQRVEDVLLSELIQRHSANATNNLAERDEADVAINKARTRRAAQWLSN